jgi:hypothetical protein
MALGVDVDNPGRVISSTMSSSPDPDLLQALEHVLETLARASRVLGSVLDTMDRGDRLTDAAIAEYRSQLQNVERDRQRMEEVVRVLWTQVERQ